ncbi:MAG: PT domain-containing protein, partial [Bifidobacteriaceae bacterium]|jgi:hypothetical protein|nr:PT domain-containing protein [Bifidobacteriaceae bacterium]
MELNGIDPVTDYDFAAYPVFGFPRENVVDRTSPVWGFTLEIGTLSNDAGVPLMEIVLAKNIHHTHYMDYGPAAWEYMSQFSRDTTTNQTIYQPTGQPTDEPTDAPTDEPTDQPTDEPTDAPSSPPPPSSSGSASAGTAATGTLPFTGSNAPALIAIALLATVLGVSMTAARRRAGSDTI